MSLSKEAEKKISNITHKTNLSGFYQFKSREDAASTINLFQQYVNDDGSFKKIGLDAHCDPIYQQLSAAIDYYKFGIERLFKRKPRPRKNNTKE